MVLNFILRCIQADCTVQAKGRYAAYRYACFDIQVGVIQSKYLACYMCDITFQMLQFAPKIGKQRTELLEMKLYASCVNWKEILTK